MRTPQEAERKDDTRVDESQPQACRPAGSTAASNALVSATDGECAVLRHMLGIDTPEVAHPKPYRDYYCANPNDEQLRAMDRKGLVELYSEHGGYAWYRCTESGRAAAFRSHKTIRYPKRKRVYLRYMSVSDVYPDLTFKEFLTSEAFAEIRRNA